MPTKVVWLVRYFIDILLSLAFDKINHSTLINKLTAYEIKGRDIEWFKYYLMNRTQEVHYEEFKSAKKSVSSGVPQGSILGPLMFLISYNDLDKRLNYEENIIYADNTVLFYAHRDINIINKCLNQDMKSVSKFCTENELILNMKKGKSNVIWNRKANRRKKDRSEIS